MKESLAELQTLESALELFQQIWLTDNDPYRTAWLPNACKYYIKRTKIILNNASLSYYLRQRVLALLSGFTRLQSMPIVVIYKKLLYQRYD